MKLKERQGVETRAKLGRSSVMSGKIKRWRESEGESMMSTGMKPRLDVE